MIKHINSKILLLISLFLISVSGSLLAEVPDYCEGLDTTEKVEQAPLSVYKKLQCATSISASKVPDLPGASGLITLQSKTTVFSDKSQINSDYCNDYATAEALDEAELSDYKKKICRQATSSCYSAYANQEVCVEADKAVFAIIPDTITQTKFAVNHSPYNVEIIARDEESVCTDYKYNEGFSRVLHTDQKIRTNGAYAKNERGCIATVGRNISNSTILEADYTRGPLVGSYTITYSSPGTDDKVLNINIIDNEAPSIGMTGNENLSTPPSGVSYSDRVNIEDNYLAELSNIVVTARFKNASSGYIGDTITLSGGSQSVWSASYEFPAGARSIEYKAIDTSGNISITSKVIEPAPADPTFGLHIIPPDNTAIDMILTPSRTTSYAYSEPSLRVTSSCVTYAWNSGTASYDATTTENIIDAIGAYVKGDNGCIMKAVRHISSSTILETDYTRGPLVGSYTITYSGPTDTTTARAIQNVKVIDNIVPTLTLQGNATIQTPPSGGTFSDAITVLDNYLPRYGSMSVLAKIKNSANSVLTTVTLANTTGTSWGSTYSIPTNSSKIEYIATDSSGNVSATITRSITPPPTVTQHLSWVSSGGVTGSGSLKVIEPLSTRSYAYVEPSNSLTSICTTETYSASDGRYNKTESTQTIATLGAFLNRSNGCHQLATRVISNETIFDTAPITGPLLGEYSITYSSSLVTDELVKPVNIVDTILPTVTLDSEDPAEPNSDGSFTERMTIDDNYLPEYSNITISVAFRDEDEVLGDICTDCSIVNSSGNIWDGEFTVPNGSTSILYSISDVAGNITLVEREVENGGPAEFLVNTYTRYYQRYPATDALAMGGFVIVWQSYYQDRSGWGIYAQRYDIDGNTVGDEFLVNTRTYHHQQRADVAGLTDGGFVVTWDSYYQDGSYTGVYGQRYDAEGNTLGDEFQVNTYTRYFQQDPSIKALLDGGFVITWHSYYQDRSGYGIYAQRYDATGAKSGDEFRVNTVTRYSQYYPDITELADGGFLASWHTYESWPVYSYSIYAQRYDATGATVGDEFRVNTHLQRWRYKFNSSAAGTPDGGFIISWQSYYQDRSGYGIYAQRYDATGALAGEEFKVNTYTRYDQLRPTVKVMLDGSFVIVWHSYHQDLGRYDYGVFAQKYNADGTINGEEFQVNTHYPNHQYNHDASYLADGGLLITWQSAYQDGSYDGVYGQLYPGSGNVSIGGPRYQMVVLATGASLEPSATSSYAYTEASETITSVCEVHTLDENTEEVTVTTSTQTIDAIGAYVKSNFGCIAVATREIANNTIFEEDQSFGPLIGMYQNTYSSPLVNFPRSVFVNVIDSEAPSATFESEDPAEAGEDGFFVERITIADNYLAGYNNITVEVSFEDENNNETACSVEDCGFTIDGKTNVWESDFEIPAGSKVIQYVISDESGNEITLEKDVKGLSTDDFLVNTHTSRSQSYQAVGVLADGGFVVTWHSYYQDGSSDGIYAQRYDMGANAVGNEFQVNTHTSRQQQNPQIAGLEDGGYVITWMSYYQDYYWSYGIYAQRYNADGTTNGGEFQVNTYVRSNQRDPSVAGLKNGGFVITWASSYQEPDRDGYGIWAQRYDAAGNALGDEFLVNTFTRSYQYKPDITSLQNGGFLITWMSYSQEGWSNRYEVMAQQYDENGVRSGSEILVNSRTSDYQRYSKTASLADGGFVITWQSNRQDGSYDGVYAQRYDASGNTKGSEFQVNTYTRYYQDKPDVTGMRDGGFIITWRSYYQDGYGYGVYAQRYDIDGNTVGDEFMVNTYWRNNQMDPAIVSLPNGSYVITWFGYGDYGLGDRSPYGVYGKLYYDTKTPNNTRLLQIRNSGMFTKAELSIIEYGEDFTGGDTDELMMFELWLDASQIRNLSTFGVTTTEFRGYSFDLDWNTAELDEIDSDILPAGVVAFTNDAAAVTAYNRNTGQGVAVSSRAIVDNDFTNDGPPYVTPSSRRVGRFYVNPNQATVNFTMKDIVVVTSGDNIYPRDYSFELNVR